MNYWQTVQKINPETGIDTETPSPLQHFIRKESLGKVFEEMAKLPHREVKIILMHSYEGRTLNEVRKKIVNVETGKPVSIERVRQLEARALNKIRNVLVDGGYGLE